MAYLEDKSFYFVSRAPSLSSETFSVVNFKGSEGISRTYEFDIKLVTRNADIDLDEVLAHPVTLYLRPDNALPVHGVLANLEQQSEVDGNIFYRARLVPRLWMLSLYSVSEVYLDMTFPQILEKVLQEGELAADDYDIRFMRQYRQWSYVCQYQENHLDFISRWMEREGVYYFFEQGEDKEKLVITDTRMAHVDLPDEKQVNYSPPSGMEISGQKNAVTAFVSRQQPVPKKVTVQDFNYRKSPPGIAGEAEVSAQGRGEVHIYGEHVKTDDEAREYAGLRAEEILCRKKVYYGESAAAFLRPGFYFDLERHYREDYNRKYLLTDLNHEGSQAAILLAGVNVDLSQYEEKPYYLNNLEAIASDVQFRPERKTKKPRFYGTINAKVEAEGSGKYAELDPYGRYKVKLPFDRSDRKGQKASRWVRMASPYAGPDEGMHFPLRKGAEVLLTFNDGDPDRPIIAAAVPSAEDPNLVNDQNSVYNMLKSAGGNVMHMHDQEGRQRMLMQSPTAGSWMRIGAYNDPPDPYYAKEGDSLDSFEDDLGTWNLTSHTTPKAVASGDDGTTLTYKVTQDRFVAKIDDELKVWKEKLADVDESASPPTFTLNANDYTYAGSDWDNEKPGANEIKEMEFSWTSVRNPYYVAKVSGSFIVFKDPDSFALDNQTKDSGKCTIDNNDWTLGEGLSLSNGDIQKDVEFYREKDVVLQIRDMGTVTPGVDGIRLNTEENLWFQSFHRYGEFYGGRPPDINEQTGQTESCTKKMMDYFGSDYNPTNLLKRHGSHDATTLMDVLDEGAHVKVSSFDSFLTQEGNIYDFGGYWNYNLGNSYVEEHIDQQAKLNDSHEYDLLNSGGPYWNGFSTIKPDQHGGSKNELGLGTNIWVEKHFGDTYDYYEGNQISVNKGGTQEIQIGGRHVEEKYSGSGAKTGYSWSESGKSEEYKWSGSGAMLSYSTKAVLTNSVAKYEFNWANSITADLTFSSNLFFSLDASAKLGIEITLGARASLDLSGALDFRLDFGLAAGIGLTGHLGGYVAFNVVTQEFEGEMVGIKAQKEAALKAEQKSLIMEAITTSLKNDNVHFESGNAKLIKSQIQFRMGQLLEGIG